MLFEIISHTPVWVWGLFLLLFALGLRQMRPTQAGIVRVSITAIALTIYGLYGMIKAFPQHSWALLIWLGVALTMLAWGMRQPLPAGTRYDPATRQFQIAGSVVPLMLYMGILISKYVVTVSLVIHPEWSQRIVFVSGVSVLYGVFSGFFITRLGRLWRLAMQHHRPAWVGSV